MQKLNKRLTHRTTSTNFTPLAISFIYAFICLTLIGCSVESPKNEEIYDLVLIGGRVLDPESGFDGIANIAIQGKTIKKISMEHLSGKEVINVEGLVVTPGFIDLHSHAMSPLGQQLQVKDGVTTALELEAGVYPIKATPKLFNGKARINYGASVGHMAIRQRLFEFFEKPHLLSPRTVLGTMSTKQSEPNSAFIKPADASQLKGIQKHLQTGLNSGGLGIGLLLDYFSAALSKAELDMVFTVAADADMPVFVHIRRGLPGDTAGLLEIIILAKKFQASVHICHINGAAMSGIEEHLKLVNSARADGVDITTEAYPYNAGSTKISAAVFNKDWQSIFGISYGDVEWAETGERFSDEKMWNEYKRRYPDGQVIHHYGKEPWTMLSLQEPDVIVASDAMPIRSLNERVHPRGIGTFSRVLRKFFDNSFNNLTLIELIGKMTLLPAKRLENFAPAFTKKGRLQVGADADITVFDPTTISDRATYKSPLSSSIGIIYVLVNGDFVVKDANIVKDSYPGSFIRSANLSMLTDN